MAASVFDSALHAGLFGDREAAALLSDSAEIRAMLLVEGELARAQGARGIIPADSAEAIWRASREVQIDPAALAAETGCNGVAVPALVQAFRAAMQAPEHAQYVHRGATSQDITDTALALRLRRIAALLEARIRALLGRLGALAEAHAGLPMAARSWGQVATVTSFGAVVASWGAPLLSHLDRLGQLRPRVFLVSLSGAAGTAAALGPQAAGLRADLAAALGLGDPQRSWHSSRDGPAEFAGWLALVTGSLGKMGQDLQLMAQSGIEEVSLPGGGGSSTMPQKSNPVQPALLVALAGHAAALSGALQGAQVHALQRDGAAWMREWLALPQLCMAAARALSVAGELAAGLAPRPAEMERNIAASRGTIFAEALVFALAARMPRPQAQERVKEMCRQVGESGRPLAGIVAETFPGWDLSDVFSAGARLGAAPEEALAFARRARECGACAEARGGKGAREY